MGPSVSEAIIQKAVVTVVPTNDLYVEITPVVNTSVVQQIGIAIAGADQTITVRPVGG